MLLCFDGEIANGLHGFSTALAGMCDEVNAMG